MNAILLISFTLHVIIFLWLIFITAQLYKAKEAEKKNLRFRNEMEQIFESYMFELKEENERLLLKLEKFQNYKGDIQPKKPSTQDLEPTDSNMNLNSITYERPMIKPMEKPLNNNTDTKIQSKVVNQDPNVKKDEIYIQSLTAQALLLKNQGYNLNDIAKQLNKGKTEIELLLKFRQ